MFYVDSLLEILQLSPFEILSSGKYYTKWRQKSQKAACILLWWKKKKRMKSHMMYNTLIIIQPCWLHEQICWKQKNDILFLDFFSIVAMKNKSKRIAFGNKEHTKSRNSETRF